jgi:Flavin-binding monooxygenase-like
MLGQFSDRYCIIGAGASGIAVAKTFVERAIPFDLLEREHDIGGLWNISTNSGIVYESTHLISAISTSAFEDYPIEPWLPGAGPDYPDHAWVLDYFRKYVDAFGIAPHLQTSTKVETVQPADNGCWHVQIAGEVSPRLYAGIVVANGHHDKPRRPSYPGTFAGEIIHSRDYKSQRQVRDKRVLVVGAGNSGCDIAKDAAFVSNAPVYLSMRRGTWFVPKFILGFPTGDVLANVEWALTPLPRALKAYLFQASLWVLQGPPSRYKLPDPDCRIDSAHPTMSDEIPRLSAHGRIVGKPAIERFDGHDVVFTDGSRVSVDMIVLATGYELSIPFLDPKYYQGSDGKPRLYLNTAHPDHENLYFAGLIQANGSIWRLAALQGKLIANAIVAAKIDPSEARTFRNIVQHKVGPVSRQTFVPSERHKLETNYFDYARTLKKAHRVFKNAARKNWPQQPAPPPARAPTQHAAE